MRCCATVWIDDRAGELVGRNRDAVFIRTVRAAGSTTGATAEHQSVPVHGSETDATGLDFMRARYYNPIAQRFISQDPIGLLGGQANLYAYVFNQPMNLTDPLGLSGG